MHPPVGRSQREQIHRKAAFAGLSHLHRQGRDRRKTLLLWRS